MSNIVIHPAWLASGWPGLSEAERTLLLGGARVQGRLLQMLADRHGWTESAIKDGPDTVLAGRSAAGIRDAATMAGAVWHARPIRQVIAASDVGALNDTIGASVRAFALANIALAVAPAERVDVATLGARITQAGAQCLAAWLLRLPPGLRRITLPKLPPGTIEATLARANHEQGVQIMHYVARHLDDRLREEGTEA